MTIRTDDAGAAPNVDVTVNNDTGSNYDLQNMQGRNATAAASQILAAAKWVLLVHGSGGGASYATAVKIGFPTFSNTTFFKTGVAEMYTPDSTNTNNFVEQRGLAWKSTAAITRMKVAAQSTAKLKVGSQLLIYKRLAS